MVLLTFCIRCSVCRIDTFRHFNYIGPTAKYSDRVIYKCSNRHSTHLFVPRSFVCWFPIGCCQCCVILWLTPPLAFHYANDAFVTVQVKVRVRSGHYNRCHVYMKPNWLQIACLRLFGNYRVIKGREKVKVVTHVMSRLTVQYHLIYQRHWIKWIDFYLRLI